MSILESIAVICFIEKTAGWLLLILLIILFILCKPKTKKKIDCVDCKFALDCGKNKPDKKCFQKRL